MTARLYSAHYLPSALTGQDVVLGDETHAALFALAETTPLVQSVKSSDVAFRYVTEKGVETTGGYH